MKLVATTTIDDLEQPKRGSAFLVEDFGKIKAAEVDFAPFTIICGKNNSGKSYLAYLIWAFYNHQYELFHNPDSNLRAPPWFKELVSNKTIGSAPVRVDRGQVRIHVNRWLSRNKDKLAKRLLNYDGASMGSFRLHFTHDVFITPTTFMPGEVGSNLDIEFDSWAISFTGANTDQTKSNMRGWVARSVSRQENAVDNLYLQVVSHMILGGNAAGRAAYIPASRSGLLLSLSYITESLFSTLRGSRGRERSKFSAPMVSFLSSMSRPNPSSRGRLLKIAEFLESNILQGTVERDEGEVKTEFSYIPQGTKRRLPVHAASSMVTELTPVLETLRRPESGALIFEEPEAHLHLSAQRTMARALVRAANGGVPVVVTTHSDTFVQQLNFLMMLSKNKKRNKVGRALGYSSDEFLNSDDVVAYELCSAGRGSAVKRLPIGDFGVVASSLTDVVLDMSHEIIEVSE